MRRQATPRRSAATFLAALAITFVFGCGGDAEQDASKPPPRPKAGKIRLMIVDDQLLAASIDRLRGEWEARSGGEIQIIEADAETLLADEPLAADAVIYPARYLGTLAERKAIVPIREKILEQSGYYVEDLLPTVRNRETRWGDEMHALPFGSPTLMLFYRADQFEADGHNVPETWEEFDRLASQIEGGAVEPLADGWAGRMLLARAAAYAKHRSQYSTLFDMTTMDPLIAGPPFVRALAELAAAREGGAPRVAPNEAVDQMRTGATAMAIGWPSALAQTEPKETGESQRIDVVELPGSPDVFDDRQHQWRTRGEADERRATLLGVSGRIGSVTSAARNVPSAMRLLAWLSGEEMSRQVGPASAATTMFRRSHLAAPRAWVGSELDSAAAKNYADAVERALSRDAIVFVPRLPGSDEYMAALDAAVVRVLDGDVTPEESLQTAADQWQTITDRLGRESQRAAYQRSLGIEP